MVHTNCDAERRAIYAVADLMAAAARTAPKGCGADRLELVILDGEEKADLVKEMRQIAAETGADFFNRDANNVEASPCIVLIGVRNDPLGLENCGNCGFSDCAAMAAAGANCAFNVTDLGIAVGSAVSVAADHRIDNRVLFSAGKAAIRRRCLSDAVRLCYGIPLSVTAKSPFFDRG